MGKMPFYRKAYYYFLWTHCLIQKLRIMASFVQLRRSQLTLLIISSLVLGGLLVFLLAKFYQSSFVTIKTLPTSYENGKNYIENYQKHPPMFSDAPNSFLIEVAELQKILDQHPDMIQIFHARLQPKLSSNITLVLAGVKKESNGNIHHVYFPDADNHDVPSVLEHVYPCPKCDPPTGYGVVPETLTAP